MKDWKYTSRIEPSYRTHHFITRVKPAIGPFLAVILFMIELALPGYCWSQHVSAQVTTQTADLGWRGTGALNNGRYGHTATLLKDGRVLVAGGGGFSCGGNCLGFITASSERSAELYDPETGMWSFTGGLHKSRVYHKALLLPDGQVLVAGGATTLYGEVFLTSAELYDPATGQWRRTGGFNTIRFLNSMTLLADGRVLADGASKLEGNIYVVDSAELFDPVKETWRTTAAPGGAAGISNGKRALLPDGKVLAVLDSTTALLYDPTTETWSRLPSPGYGGTLTMLRNGKVLLTGELGASLYDPMTGIWSLTDNSGNSSPATLYTTTLLADGRVLVAGGYSTSDAIAGEKIYDPDTGKWSFTSRLAVARDYHTATLLADGSVLVAGGIDGNIYDELFLRDSAELYGPATELIPIPIPNITGVSVEGKRLIVRGENFDAGAIILINDEAQVTKNDPQNPKAGLIGKKAGKKIKTGDKLQVRNPNGSFSGEFTFTGS